MIGRARRGHARALFPEFLSRCVSKTRCFPLAALAAALALSTAPLAAQPTLAPSAAAPMPPIAVASAAPGQSAHALTQDDVQTWLDGFMPYAIARGGIAGAVVVVVKDGQVLAQKGYGYADVAKHTPVDPATTLFRPARSPSSLPGQR